MTDAKRTGWAPTGAQLALELAQNPLTDDESFLQWVERHANRYIEAARQSTPIKLCERCAGRPDERDTARYRWLKETFYGETFPDLYDSPTMGGGVTSKQFDADIDAEIAKEAARAKDR